jgi:hypothetical protein
MTYALQKSRGQVFVTKFIGNLDEGKKKLLTPVKLVHLRYNLLLDSHWQHIDDVWGNVGQVVQKPFFVGP